MIVPCSCGARLTVPDTAAGKRARCPKCAGAVPIPDVLEGTLVEPEVGLAVQEPPPLPVRRSVSRRAGIQRIRRPVTRRRPVPWDYWTVVVLMTLGFLSNLVQVVQGKGGVLGLIISGLLVLGVFSRSSIAWWIITIVSTLFALLCFALGAMVSIPELRLMLFLIGLLYLVVPGLLVCSRVRGTYS